MRVRRALPQQTDRSRQEAKDQGVVVSPQADARLVERRLRVKLDALRRQLPQRRLNPPDAFESSLTASVAAAVAAVLDPRTAPISAMVPVPMLADPLRRPPDRQNRVHRLARQRTVTTWRLPRAEQAKRSRQSRTWMSPRREWPSRRGRALRISASRDRRQRVDARREGARG